jgi:hypothetical protein
MRRNVFLALVLGTALLATSGASAESANDKAMSQRIGVILKESGQLRDYRVGVKYVDGVAWLTGTVTDVEQADTAVRLAREVDGVVHVISQLEYSTETAPAPSLAKPSRRNNGLAAHVDTPTTMRKSSGVVQAFAASPASRNARNSQNWKGASRSNEVSGRARQLPRNNMPLPAMRMANAGPPIRQVSSQQGIYQAGGSCPPGGQGMMGGGAGMAGAGMDLAGMGPVPVGFVPHGSGRGPSYDNAQMPGYAWPSYASYPNYAALTYPQQYSPTAWPYIGPFYPYPQVPLAWRKVALEWDDGWWFLDFSAHNSSH